MRQRSQGFRVYVMASPIGDILSDFSVAALRVLERIEHVFIEAEDETAQRLRERGVIRPHHKVFSFEDPGGCLSVVERLVRDRVDFAVLASSGIPGLVDPGWQVLDWLYRSGHWRDAQLHPVGVSSALDGALALAGQQMDRFVFGGHYPEHYLLRELRSSHRSLPIIHYVRGPAIQAYLDSAWGAYRPSRVLIFQDLRKRDRSRVWVQSSQQEQTTLSEQPETDYVVLCIR